MLAVGALHDGGSQLRHRLGAQHQAADGAGEGLFTLHSSGRLLGDLALVGDVLGVHREGDGGAVAEAVGSYQGLLLLQAGDGELAVLQGNGLAVEGDGEAVHIGDGDNHLLAVGLVIFYAGDHGSHAVNELAAHLGASIGLAAAVVAAGGLGTIGIIGGVIVVHILGVAVTQRITIGIGIRGAVLIAAGAVVVVHGRLGADSGTLQVSIIHQLLGKVVAQGFAALEGLVLAVGVAAGAVVVIHGGRGAGGTTLQVGIIHQFLGEVVVQGGLQEAMVGVVSLRGIHVAVLVGKILAAVGAVPVDIVAGLGAGGCNGIVQGGICVIIGVLIR